MDQDLFYLIELQKIMNRLKELEQKLENLPDDFAPTYEAYHQLLEERKKWQAEKDNLHKSMKEKEWDLEDAKAKKQKLKRQSSMITSPKDYSNYLKTMDQISRNIQDLEEEILTLMEKLEKAESNLARTEESFQNLKSQYEKGMQGWERKKQDWIQEKEGLERDKTIISQKLPQELLATFWHLYETRHGLAVAPVENYACGGCHVAIRPQQYAEIRSCRSIQRCDGCSRFLYYEEK